MLTLEIVKGRNGLFHWQIERDGELLDRGSYSFESEVEALRDARRYLEEHCDERERDE